MDLKIERDEKELTWSIAEITSVRVAMVGYTAL